MTRFAALYPERINKLVYLDAGYDWSDPTTGRIFERMPEVQWSPSAEELRSFETYKKWFTERGPRRAAEWSPKVEAYARDFVTEEPDGTLTFVTSESWRATLSSYRRDNRAVKAPALAIYVPEWVPMNAITPTTLSALQRWAREEWVPWQQAHRRDFEQGMSRGQVHMLASGDHMTFLFTQEAEIVRLMRRFLLEP